jgi:acetyl-CoA carboxylase carboxyl transferase subunit alpha
MMAKEIETPGLAFERPLYELEARLTKLERSAAGKPEAEEEIRRLRRQWATEARRIYGNLSAWETVQVARHKDRPQSADYIALVFDDFFELHGDKFFGDDRAIRTGFGKLDQFKVMLVAHMKGRNLKERSACYWGCAHPEGYRKALSKMKMAAKFGLPIVCLIDTPGAYPGIGAEERGQFEAIARNMHEMARLPTPIVCVVIGEGGSGGALGIGVGDRVAMLEHAYYSVISPEGCAGILWKSHKYAEQAARALKFTSENLAAFGVVDDVIQEPLGGAHRDHYRMSRQLKSYLIRALRSLQNVPIDKLLDDRYQKFRRMGVYLERQLEPAAAEPKKDEIAADATADQIAD